MATKKVKTPKFIATLDTQVQQTIQSTGKIYDKAYEITESLVDEAYRAGTGWNKLMQKAIKGGVKIFGKQQDLVLTAIEGAVAQTSKGAERFQEMIGVDIINEVKSQTQKVKHNIDDMISNVSDKIEHTMQSETITKVKSEVTKVQKAAKKTVKETAAKIKEVEDKITQADAKIAKTNNGVKSTARKASAKTKTAASKVAKKSTAKVDTIKKAKTELSSIKGIGPKTQNILQDAGINTIADLSMADAKTLDMLLMSKGKIYSTVNTQTWIDEAKNLIK